MMNFPPFKCENISIVHTPLQLDSWQRKKRESAEQTWRTDPGGGPGGRAELLSPSRRSRGSGSSASPPCAAAWRGSPGPPDPSGAQPATPKSGAAAPPPEAGPGPLGTREDMDDLCTLILHFWISTACCCTIVKTQ